MKQLLRTDNKLVCVLMIIVGIILLSWPGFVMNTVAVIIGAALLLCGVVCVVTWYRGRAKGESWMTLLEGGIMALVGIILLLAKGAVFNILPVVIGILIIINGVVNLAQALDQKRLNYRRWAVSLALAILTIVLGLMVLFNPFSTNKLLIMAVGIVAIYNGVSNLWIESRYRKI